jgi:hypothetical protein
MELLLFLFFIVPGVIYGIWRLAARKDVCASCLSDSLVPINSPMGRTLANRAPRPGVSGASFCASCGSPISGKFCSSCGTVTGA